MILKFKRCITLKAKNDTMTDILFCLECYILIRSDHSGVNRLREQLTSRIISQVENVIESDHPFAGEKTGNRVSRRSVLLSAGLLDARLHRLLGRPSSGRYYFGGERRGRKQGTQQFCRGGHPS